MVFDEGEIRIRHRQGRHPWHSGTRRRRRGRRGLSHLGLSHGAIYELAKWPSGKWLIAHCTLIEESAGASVADASGGVIIATSKSLLRYQERALVRLHGPATQWYVNSLVRSADGTLYVGTYFGIVRLTPAAPHYVETLLVPPDCPVTADHHVENQCAMCRCAMPFVPPAQLAQSCSRSLLTDFA